MGYGSRACKMIYFLAQKDILSLRCGRPILQYNLVEFVKRNTSKAHVVPHYHDSGLYQEFVTRTVFFIFPINRTVIHNNAADG